MMSDMNPAIIAAIIGAAGSVVAAFISVLKGQRQFRNESSEQHGVLLAMVERTFERTTDIHMDLMDVKKDLSNHIAEHDSPPVKKKTTKKAV